MTGPTARHLSILALALLVLSAGRLLDVRDGRVACGNWRLPSTCWLRATPLGGCPGCGLTRSVVEICHGHPAESLAYHPGGFLVAAIAFLEIAYRLTLLGMKSPPRWLAATSRLEICLWLGVLVAGTTRWAVGFLA